MEHQTEEGGKSENKRKILERRRAKRNTADELKMISLKNMISLALSLSRSLSLYIYIYIYTYMLESIYLSLGIYLSLYHYHSLFPPFSISQSLNLSLSLSPLFPSIHLFFTCASLNESITKSIRWICWPGTFQ